MKRVLCMLLCCAVLLCSCSKQEAAQGVSDKEILIGTCLPLSGFYGEVATAFYTGMQGYIKQVNSDGGIGGRTLKLIAKDDGGNAVQTILQMQNLLEKEKVFALLGIFGDETVHAAQPYLEEMGAPVVYAASGMASLYGDPKTQGDMIFPVQPMDPTEGRMLVLRAAEHGARRIGILYTNDEKGRGMLEGATKQAELLGSDYAVSTVMVEEGQTDFTTAQIVFQNFKADAILLAAGEGTLINAIHSFLSVDSKLPMYASYVCATKETAEAVSNAYLAEEAPFAVYANYWVSRADTKALAAFRKALEKVDGSQYGNNSFALAGYMAAHVFCEGLRRVDTDMLTWERFREAMESQPVQLPLSGEVDYGEGRRAGVQTMGLMRMSNSAAVWYVNRQPEDLYAIEHDILNDMK